MILLYSQLPQFSPILWKVVNNSLSSETIEKAIRKFVETELHEDLSIKEEVQHTYRKKGSTISGVQCATMESDLVLYNSKSEKEFHYTLILHACVVEYDQHFIQNYRS